MSILSSNSENFKKYQANLEKYSRGNMKPTGIDYDKLPLHILISQLCKEGEDLLKQDEMEKNKKSPKTESIRLESKLGATDNNPYVRARTQILNKMTESDRKSILKMEDTKKTDNATYRNFAANVTELGDKFSA